MNANQRKGRKGREDHLASEKPLRSSQFTFQVINVR
jgi:hypothetical protein